LLTNLTLGLQNALQSRGQAAQGQHGGGGGFGMPRAQQQAPRIPDPEQFRQYILSNNDMLQQMLQGNPQLADAVLNGNLQYITQHLTAQANSRQQQERLRQQLQMQLARDPFNVDLQRQIEEEIAQEQINDNMENAIEHNPESFGRVVMLYVDSEVNGQPVKAFVDSGAQSTIMSAQCAKRCGIFRLLDKRFAGIAKGVGTAKILGAFVLNQE
jgi:DNA damage-inducible protein 1